PHIGDAGRGINRKRPQLLGAGQGINRKRPHLLGAGKGINRKIPHMGDAGLCEEWTAHIEGMMLALADRYRRVRVCCGDWARVCGPTPTEHNGLSGVFLDPPYAHAERDSELYAVEMPAADAVREWAVAHGDNPAYRIALCGYEGEHAMPDGWFAYAWKAHGGYGNRAAGRGRENASREVIWFSPHCLQPAAPTQGALLV
ncbi:MAG: hypothetical protein NUW01_08110, partial [Gemmatimonadaceae bacterium]|nr:hypothetical protein [Gemmatimonadaceae bacterium]